eukprot:g372.t1
MFRNSGEDTIPSSFYDDIHGCGSTARRLLCASVGRFHALLSSLMHDTRGQVVASEATELTRQAFKLGIMKLWSLGAGLAHNFADVGYGNGKNADSCSYRSDDGETTAEFSTLVIDALEHVLLNDGDILRQNSDSNVTETVQILHDKSWMALSSILTKACDESMLSWRSASDMRRDADSTGRSGDMESDLLKTTLNRGFDLIEREFVRCTKAVACEIRVLKRKRDVRANAIALWNDDKRLHLRSGHMKRTYGDTTQSNTLGSFAVSMWIKINRIHYDNEIIFVAVDHSKNTDRYQLPIMQLYCQGHPCDGSEGQDCNSIRLLLTTAMIVPDQTNCAESERNGSVGPTNLSLQSNASIEIDRWYHIVCVYKENETTEELCMHIDGASDATISRQRRAIAHAYSVKIISLLRQLVKSNRGVRQLCSPRWTSALLSSLEHHHFRSQSIILSILRRVLPCIRSVGVLNAPVPRQKSRAAGSPMRAVLTARGAEALVYFLANLVFRCVSGDDSEAHRTDSRSNHASLTDGVVNLLRHLIVSKVWQSDISRIFNEAIGRLSSFCLEDYKVETEKKSLDDVDATEKAKSLDQAVSMLALYTFGGYVATPRKGSIVDVPKFMIASQLSADAKVHITRGDRSFCAGIVCSENLLNATKIEVSIDCSGRMCKNEFDDQVDDSIRVHVDREMVFPRSEDELSAKTPFLSGECLDALSDILRVDLARVGQGSDNHRAHVTGESNFPSVRLRDISLKAGSGAWYYEVVVLSDGLMQIGWCDTYFRGDSLRGHGVGDNRHSWAFDGFRCKKWNGASDMYGRRWKCGDVVGCLVSFGTNVCTMRFYLNGSDLGVAFTVNDVTGNLYPAASINMGQSLKFNIGTEPFRHFPFALEKNRANETTEVHVRPISHATSITALQNAIAQCSNARASTGFEHDVRDVIGGESAVDYGVENDEDEDDTNIDEYEIEDREEVLPENITDSYEQAVTADEEYEKDGIEFDNDDEILYDENEEEYDESLTKLDCGENTADAVDNANHRREVLVDNLIAMGFPVEWCVRAAHESRVGLDENLAISWIIEQMERETGRRDEKDDEMCEDTTYARNHSQTDGSKWRDVSKSGTMKRSGSGYSVFDTACAATYLAEFCEDAVASEECGTFYANLRDLSYDRLHLISTCNAVRSLDTIMDNCDDSDLYELSIVAESVLSILYSRTVFATLAASTRLPRKRTTLSQSKDTSARDILIDTLRQPDILKTTVEIIRMSMCRVTVLPVLENRLTPTVRDLVSDVTSSFTGRLCYTEDVLSDLLLEIVQREGADKLCNIETVEDNENNDVRSRSLKRFTTVDSPSRIDGSESVIETFMKVITSNLQRAREAQGFAMVHGSRTMFLRLLCSPSDTVMSEYPAVEMSLWIADMLLRGASQRRESCSRGITCMSGVREGPSRTALKNSHITTLDSAVLNTSVFSSLLDGVMIAQSSASASVGFASQRTNYFGNVSGSWFAQKSLRLASRTMWLMLRRVETHDFAATPWAQSPRSFLAAVQGDQLLSRFVQMYNKERKHSNIWSVEMRRLLDLLVGCECLAIELNQVHDCSIIGDGAEEEDDDGGGSGDGDGDDSSVPGCAKSEQLRMDLAIHSVKAGSVRLAWSPVRNLQHVVSSDEEVIVTFKVQYRDQSNYDAFTTLHTFNGDGDTEEAYEITSLCQESTYLFRVSASLHISPSRRSAHVLSNTVVVEPRVAVALAFDKHACGQNLHIRSDSLMCTNVVNKKWNTVRATVGFSVGVHHWEVLVNKCVSKNIFIGVGTENAELENYVGSDRFAWGYLANKAIWHRKAKVRSYGLLFREGDIVRVTLDMNIGSLMFALNGTDLGVAVPAGELSGLTLYPVFSLYNKGDSISIVPMKNASLSLDGGMNAYRMIRQCSDVVDALRRIRHGRSLPQTIRKSVSRVCRLWQDRTLRCITLKGPIKILVDTSDEAIAFFGGLSWLHSGMRAWDSKVGRTLEVVGSARGVLWFELIDDENARKMMHDSFDGASSFVGRTKFQCERLLPIDSDNESSVPTKTSNELRCAVSPRALDGWWPLALSRLLTRINLQRQRTTATAAVPHTPETNHEQNSDSSFRRIDSNESKVDDTVKRKKMIGDRNKKLAWTAQMDQQLAEMIGAISNHLGISELRIPEDCVTNWTEIDAIELAYPHLRGASKKALRLRCSLLMWINAEVISLLQYLDSAEEYPRKTNACKSEDEGEAPLSLTELLYDSRHLLFPGTKLTMLRWWIDKRTKHEPSSALENPKADREGSSKFAVNSSESNQSCLHTNTASKTGQYYRDQHAVFVPLLKLCNMEDRRTLSHTSHFAKNMISSSKTTPSSLEHLLVDVSGEISRGQVQDFRIRSDKFGIPVIVPRPHIGSSEFNEKTDLSSFRFLGRLLGIAIRSCRPFPLLSLPTIIRRLIDGERDVNLRDIDEIDPHGVELVRRLKSLQASPEISKHEFDSAISALCPEATFDINPLGGDEDADVVWYDVFAQGKSSEVMTTRRVHYADIDSFSETYETSRAINWQIHADAIRSGLYDTLPFPIMGIFTTEEVLDIASGHRPGVSKLLTILQRSAQRQRNARDLNEYAE